MENGFAACSLCDKQQKLGALIRKALLCETGGLVFQMGFDGNAGASKPQ